MSSATVPAGVMSFPIANTVYGLKLVYEGT